MALVLWGAGGHGAVIRDAALSSGNYTDVLFVDDAAADLPPSERHGAPVIGTPDILGSLDPSACTILVSVGDNRSRARCFEVARHSLSCATVIHPSAIFSSSARIGEGSVVLAGAIVNAGAVIGRNVIINSGAIVEHHSILGDHVHVGPGAVLCGASRLDDFVLFGAGAVACPGAHIGYAAVVGAGAVVPKNAAAHCISAGVPARVISRAIAYVNN